jgi:predicted nucleic acid-binding Zn ribbon protein
MRRRSRSGLSDALDGLFSGLESGPKVRESLAVGYWAQVVGAQAAAATEAETIRDGILFVKTKSSVWSHELTMLKGHIIQELNKRIGRTAVKDIIFRAKGVKEAEQETAPILPDAEILAAVVLSPDEQKALDGDMAQAETITDARIRASLQQRMLRERRLRHWQLENGWKACANCTALHRTEGDICPICRLCG